MLYEGKNLDILKSLTQPTNAKVNTTIGKLNNMLMQLRKWVVQSRRCLTSAHNCSDASSIHTCKLPRASGSFPLIDECFGIASTTILNRVVYPCKTPNTSL